MLQDKKINANPTVYAVSSKDSFKLGAYDANEEDIIDPFDSEEIFGTSKIQSFYY